MKASAHRAKALFKPISIIPVANATFPELSLRLFADTRNVNEGLLQHKVVPSTLFAGPTVPYSHYTVKSI